MSQITGIINNIDWKDDTFNLLVNDESLKCWEELICLDTSEIKNGDEVTVTVLGNTPDGYKIVNIMSEEFIDE